VFKEVRKIILNHGEIFDEAINPSIIETRMKMPLTDYLQNCIDRLEKLNDRGLLSGLGELLDEKMKHFVRMKLLKETIDLLMFYKQYPIIAAER